jgi:signal transduction histidine kinase
MTAPSIRRQLMRWVLGALCVGVPILMLAAYQLTLGEIDEVLNDSLRQTALLLADRDLAGALAIQPLPPAAAAADSESKLVAIARRPDGTLLFTSDPALAPRFAATPGLSVQQVNDQRWHVYTVLQPDRTVQVAQPTAVRREGAAESASQLLVALLVLMALIGALLVIGLRRGMKPLAVANEALARRNAQSLAALDLEGVPIEVLPIVQTLNDLLRRLEAAFEAQRNFVADAAHELRSPITALQLQVQILERSRDPAERALATTELAQGIVRARHLIEQLLVLSRAAEDQERGRPVEERVSLAVLTRAVVARWSADAERRRIDLGAEVPEEVSVDGDAAQLEILLGNLVENALRYTPPGGIVDVVAERAGGLPTLRVIDNGPGIGPAERERVFDRFYRSPQAVAGSPTGSGLGLAIVRSIAERHHATVSLHDGRAGVGLEVRVTFKASA